MLIRLEDADSPQSLLRALEHPARMEDGVLYAAGDVRAARKLKEARLPCVFVEVESAGEDAHVYGVDYVIRQKDAGDDGWRRDQELLLGIWKRFYGLPWEIAVTPRLLVRESVMEDLPELLSLYEEERENPDVKPFSAHPKEEFAAYIKNRYPFYGYGLWTVAERASGRVAGRIGFEETHDPAQDAGREAQVLPELSYLIARDLRGRGYAGEAASAVLLYARERLGFTGALLRTSPENTGSRRLAARLGFQEDKNFRNFFRMDLTNR